MAIKSLNDGLIKLSAFAKENPIGTAVGVLGTGAIVGLSSAAVIGTLNRRKSKRNKSSSSRKRRSRIKHTKRGLIQDRKRRSKQKWEVAYRKRKLKSKAKRGVHYTKKGQPYKIMSNGRARFIKRKGGNR